MDSNTQLVTLLCGRCETMFTVTPGVRCACPKCQCRTVYVAPDPAVVDAVLQAISEVISKSLNLAYEAISDPTARGELSKIVAVELIKCGSSLVCSGLGLSAAQAIGIRDATVDGFRSHLAAAFREGN